VDENWTELKTRGSTAEAVATTPQSESIQKPGSDERRVWWFGAGHPLPVGVASVADGDDVHETLVVIDGANDSVVADAKPPEGR